MTEEAIQKDVSEDKHDNSRLNMMEELASKREAEYADNQDSEDTDEDESQEVDQQEEEEQTKPDEAVNKDEEDPDEYDTLIVNGKELKESKKKIYEAGKRALQKESSADQRLKEATDLLKEVQRQAQNLQPSKPDVVDAESSGIDQKTIEAIQVGTHEEAKSALEKLLSNQKAIKPEDIERIVEQRVTAMTEKKRIHDKFKESFQELYDDPRLRKLVVEEADRLLNDGQPNVWETYQKAAESIQEWSGKRSIAKDPLKEKADKKRSVVSIKGSGAVKPVETEEKEETPQDIIKQMRKARGQI